MNNPLIRKMERLCLCRLTEEEKQVLGNATLDTMHFGADHDIVHEGDRPGCCNLLLEGIVCRYKMLRNGKRQIMSFELPGDIFDTQSFILKRMDHSIGTLTPSTVAVIPHETLREILENHPRIAWGFWKDTLIDAAIFRDWMTSIGRRPAYVRLAHLMCEVFVRLDAVGLAQKDRIDWPITQTEIGDALGLSNVHVNRSVQKLRADGLITLGNGTLIIHDWQELKRAGDFDPDYLHISRGADAELGPLS